MGVAVKRFSIGFGPALFKWRSKSNTDFVLATIPLGGYISMLDTRNEEHVPAEEQHMAFDKVTPWKQIIIAASGPLANLVLAMVLLWFVALGGVTAPIPYVGTVTEGSLADQANLQSGEEIVALDGQPVTKWMDFVSIAIRRVGDTGFLALTTETQDGEKNYSIPISNWLSNQRDPDVLQEIGFTPGILPVVNQVSPGSPADAAGLQSGDRITAVDAVSINQWDELVTLIRASPGTRMSIQFQRDEVPFLVIVAPKIEVAPDGTAYGVLGVTQGHPTRKVGWGLIGGLQYAVSETWNFVTLTVVSIKKMIFGEMNASNLAGPVSIANIAGSLAQSGFHNYLTFLAMLSISLCLINLLPIPVLDGGHIVYALIQAITRKPVSVKLQRIATATGLALLGGLFVLVLYNDIARLAAG